MNTTRIRSHCGLSQPWQGQDGPGRGGHAQTPVLAVGVLKSGLPFDPAFAIPFKHRLTNKDGIFALNIFALTLQ